MRDSIGHPRIKSTRRESNRPSQVAELIHATKKWAS
jgi:hypothetical protein